MHWKRWISTPTTLCVAVYGALFVPFFKSHAISNCREVNLPCLTETVCPTGASTIYKPANTSCHTYSNPTGVCDGRGSCGNWLGTAYAGIPVSLMYVPPGNQSSVTYSDGGTEGSITTVQWTSGDTDTVTTGISILGFTIGTTETWSAGISDGYSVKVSQTDTSSFTETNPGTSDFLSHGYDTMMIWVNGESRQFLSNGTVLWENWITSDGAPMIVQPYFICELQGTCTLTDPEKLKYFTHFSANDLNSWIALDPFATSSNPSLNPARFQQVPPRDNWFYGPDAPGDPIYTDTFQVCYNSEYDSQYGSYVNGSTAVMAQAKVQLDPEQVFSINGSVNSAATYGYSDVRTTTHSNQDCATVNLKTNNVGCAIEENFYIDAAFGTYVVIPVSSTPECH